MDIKQIFPCWNELPVNDGDFLNGKTVEEAIQIQLNSLSTSPSDPNYIDLHSKISNNINKRVTEYTRHKGERLFHVIVQGDPTMDDEIRRIGLSIVSVWESQWDEFISRHDVIRAATDDNKVPSFARKPAVVVQGE